MPEKEKLTIGIDIGGTKIMSVLWDGKKVLKYKQIKTPNNAGDLKLKIKKVVNYLGRKNPVVIGAAGVIQGKKVKLSPNIPFLKDFDFSFLEIKRLDNDARCFARAEYRGWDFFAGKTVLFITVGTGLGRALGKKGRIKNIKKFEYPEPWEKQYQKIRDEERDKKLAEFLAKKIKKLIQQHKAQICVVGGGIVHKKGFFKKLERESDFEIKRAQFGRKAPAI